MAIDIRIAQFFKLTTSDGNIRYFQNYWANTNKVYDNEKYTFAPFRVEGTASNNTGDNGIIQVLFPNVERGLRLLQAGDGNRLSYLELTTVWLTPTTDEIAKNGATQVEYFVGIGASISETTIELRFRSSLDSVISNFPARTLSRQLVGPLPSSANVSLR